MNSKLTPVANSNAIPANQPSFVELVLVRAAALRLDYQVEFLARAIADGEYYGVNPVELNKLRRKAIAITDELWSDRDFLVEVI